MDFLLRWNGDNKSVIWLDVTANPWILVTSLKLCYLRNKENKAAPWAPGGYYPFGVIPRLFPWNNITQIRNFTSLLH